MDNKRYDVSVSEYDGDVYAHASCARCRSGWGVSNGFDVTKPNARRQAIADLHAGMSLRRPKRHACVV